MGGVNFLASTPSLPTRCAKLKSKFGYARVWRRYGGPTFAVRLRWRAVQIGAPSRGAGRKEVAMARGEVAMVLCRRVTATVRMLCC